MTIAGLICCACWLLWAIILGFKLDKAKKRIKRLESICNCEKRLANGEWVTYHRENIP